MAVLAGWQEMTYQERSYFIVLLMMLEYWAFKKK